MLDTMDAVSETVEDIQPVLMPAPVPDAKKSTSFIKNAIGAIKGKDIETKIEEFSSEITMVIEGISEDQERLDKLSEQMKNQLDQFDKRLSSIEKSVGKKTAGIALFRQLTWLVGFVCVAAVIITLMKLFL